MAPKNVWLDDENDIDKVSIESKSEEEETEKVNLIELVN